MYMIGIIICSFILQGEGGSTLNPEEYIVDKKKNEGKI